MKTLTATGFTVNELAACIIAREIRDDDLIFVGVGTNGRAFTLAVGIPLTACRLAQLRHAPGATVYWATCWIRTFPACPTTSARTA